MSQRALAWVTAVAIAVLLPGAVFAASQVDEPAGGPTRVASAGEGRGTARPTGLGSLAVIDEAAPATELPVATTVPAPTSVPPPTLPRTALPVPETTTTTAPPDSATTAPTLPASAPDPGIPAKPAMPPTSSWDLENDGVTLRMRLDPTTPRAGSPVNFVIEMSSTNGPCCGVYLDFGDGHNHTADLTPDCSPGAPPAPRTRSLVVSHVYATPGIYWTTFYASSIDSCSLSLQFPRGLTTYGCIGVGPSTEPQSCPLPARPGAGYR